MTLYLKSDDDDQILENDKLLDQSFLCSNIAIIFPYWTTHFLYEGVQVGPKMGPYYSKKQGQSSPQK